MDWNRMCIFLSIQAGYVTLEFKKHVNQIYMKLSGHSRMEFVLVRVFFM